MLGDDSFMLMLMTMLEIIYHLHRKDILISISPNVWLTLAAVSAHLERLTIQKNSTPLDSAFSPQSVASHILYMKVRVAIRSLWLMQEQQGLKRYTLRRYLSS